jgi:hypothetical protein
MLAARHKLTASRVALAALCAWWARPEVDLPSQETSTAAQLGVATHAVAEAESEPIDEELVDVSFRRFVGGEAEDKAGADLSEAERGRLATLAAVWRGWWLELEPRVPWRATEKAYALSMAGNGRALEGAAHRDYSGAGADEVPGTVDLVTLGPNGDSKGLIVRVTDYKTGRGPHLLIDHEEQMLHLGTAVARTLGIDRIEIMIAHITPDGVKTDVRLVTSLDMAIYALELRRLVAGIDKAEPKPAMHCKERHCPARAVCPVTRSALFDATVPVDEHRHLSMVGPITSDEQAYHLAVRLPSIEEWTKERGRELRSYIEEHPIKGPDGRVLRGRPKKRETIALAAAGALAALESILGPNYRDAIETKVSTSFDRIKDIFRKRKEAAKATGEKVVLKDEVERARAVLRAAGALKVSEYTAYEWRDEETGT